MRYLFKNSLILIAIILTSCSNSNIEKKINENNSIESTVINYDPSNELFDRIKQVSSEQISKYLKDIPEFELNDFGFTDKSDFSNIQFGIPLQVFTLSNNVIIRTETYRVPILINGQYRSFLTIQSKESILKAVDFGAKELAGMIQNKISSETLGILRIYELQSDFLIEKSINNIYYLSLNANDNKRYTINEISKKLNKE